MRVLSLMLLLCLGGLLQAQDYKRTQNWYFGDSAGLSFATDPPTPLSGALKTWEGCSVISDTSGNLLFYTNGIKVWNKNHQVMENGDSLNAHQSSTQATLIVPWPENDSLFYVFTTDAVGQFNGLQYSLVNIKENSGLGKVIKKNILLQTPVSEKLAGTKHLNGKDYWLVARGYTNNNFYSYLINKNGLVLCPVVTPIGAIAKNISDAQGEIKFSSDGTKLAEAIYNLAYNRVDLFSFNREKGVPYYATSIPNITLPYSVEFSPGSKYLYVGNRLNYLYQYDLTSSNGNDIRSTQYEIYFSGNTTNNYHSVIQKAPNNRLYIALWDSNYLSIINAPEKGGDSCNFIFKGLHLNKKSQAGLPNFISSYFYQPNIDFAYTTNCQNDSIYFAAKGGTVHSWQIIDNQSIIHTSNQPTTSYNFIDTGGYIVKLISGNDTISKTINIEPKLKLGKDTAVCNQGAFKLTVSPNHRCLSWQDGSDSLEYSVAQTGKYYVKAYNTRGCLVSDTITVIFASLSAPVITKQHDTLFTDNGSYTYKWRYNGNITGGNSHFIKISQNGIYRVEITDSNGCANTSIDFSVTGLGVRILNADNYFSIYPIPADDKLYVQPNGNIIIKNLLLRDITGRTLEYSPSTELSVQGLSEGVYLLEITDQLNTIYVTKILIN